MKSIAFIFVVAWASWQGALAGPPQARIARISLEDAQEPQPGSAVRRPVAKSRQEYDDYQSARNSNGGAALEKTATTFAEKYPESELRRYLFSKALRQYQSENNPQGMIAMGQRVLALDPGDALALVLTATVVADGLSAGDPDRETKIAEIKRNATRALQVMGTVAATSSQSPLYRTTLESMAYSALGIMKLKTGDDSGAEKDLKTAADLPKVRPDPYIWYHLALAQDHRKKYPAALDSVEQALQLSSANPRLQRLAETEHARLNRLARHGKDAAEGEETKPE
jgi:tetratricopeptide (TPR) repeat protein